MKRRLIALLLALVTVLSMFPATALASSRPAQWITWGTPASLAPSAIYRASSPTATRQSMRASPKHSPTPLWRAGAKGPSSSISPKMATLRPPLLPARALMAARMAWGLAL